MDVLTQRYPVELGAVLGGCDVLALHSMRRDHPALALIEPPVVHVDRGISARIMRESVPFPDVSPNPMPLIQIPYDRLKQKYNLTSILHEAGHQALARLQLISPLSRALRRAVGRAGAPEVVAHLYGQWAFEIGPDFWAFALSGVAEAAAIRDLFALPSAQALHISFTGPHPPSYLRALLTFDWCRRAWGRGAWDDREREWIAAYPLVRVPPESRRLLLRARSFVPVVGRELFSARFRGLDNRTLLDLFDLSAVNPIRLQRVAGGIPADRLDLRGLSPCAQLAVFRMVREWQPIGEERLDRLMTAWLIRLGRVRHSSHRDKDD
jgi:hypothetical protein